MRKFILFVTTITIAVFSLQSCKSNDPDQSSVVKQFIYDGMTLYYLWADEVENKKPTSSDSDPSAYFKSILNNTDSEHNWSWITDDVDALIADFSGTPKDFGYVPALYWTDSTKTSIVGFVKYVYPNTPASRAGMVRGNVITKINGKTMIESNYSALFGSSAITITLLDQNYSNPKEVTIAPEVIETNPVFYHNVYEIEGHKIGYLFYTGFIANYNNKLFELFSNFKQQGITDLVLDLRYNHGGALSAATYLSSMIAPYTAVERKSPFTILAYNNYINQYFDNNKVSRIDSLGVYDNEKMQNPLLANLNLSKVYVIATGDSYSASELTTFCLNSYMDVVHIGEATGGKYTASWTVHAYDEKYGATVYEAEKLSDNQKNKLKNWGMQPIVAKYTNKDGRDFSSPGYLVPDYAIESQEKNVQTWKPIGDENDYLLAKAISLITGRIYGVKSNASNVKVKKTHFSSSFDKIRTNAVLLDNVKLSPEQYQQLIKEKN